MLAMLKGTPNPSGQIESSAESATIPGNWGDEPNVAGAVVRIPRTTAYIETGAVRKRRESLGGAMEWLWKALLTAGSVVLVMAIAGRGGRRTAGMVAALPTVTAPALAWLAHDRGAAFAADAANDPHLRFNVVFSQHARLSAYLRERLGALSQAHSALARAATKAPTLR